MMVAAVTKTATAIPPADKAAALALVEREASVAPVAHPGTLATRTNAEGAPKPNPHTHATIHQGGFRR